jgi:hypothetical protein
MVKRGFNGASAFTAVMLLLIIAFASPASAANEGSVQTVRAANASFNEFTNAPSPASETWMQNHFWRMVVYSPYFDSRTGWYPNAWTYRDAYAIYENSALASEHPEWILKDASGKDLYIPWGCSNGSCPQYAGNIANAGFRENWIEEARATLAHGYKGLYIDDVNMEYRVSNGEEQQVAPIDPATGQPMTYTAWRQYMAQFMEQIRAAFPNVEIIHNVIWFADSPARLSDPYIQREIESANGVYLERGVIDGGLTGGSGEWSLNDFLSYAEGINALNRYVVLGDNATNQQQQAYDLASYFLISDGNDAIDVGTSTPTEWWPGWETQLGQANGARYQWNGLLRRDFTGGMVLVNPPGATTQTIALPSAMQEENGDTVTSVTLPAASGIILKGVTSITPPPVEQPSAPASTRTTVETAPASPTTASNSPASPTTTPYRAQDRAQVSQSQSDGRPSQRARRRRVPTRIAGSVLRATQGSVTIQIEVQRGRRWVTLERLAAVVSQAGRYVRTLDLRAGVRYRVRALYKGASGFRPSSSKYHLLVPRVPRRAPARKQVVSRAT